MKTPQDNHEFAIFIANLTAVCTHHALSDTYTITDPLIVHRILRVLRMQIGSHCLIFDAQWHATFTITQINKKQIEGLISHITQHYPLPQAITYCVPLLKREALEEALYGLTEVGISHIQLMYTARSSKSWSTHDMKRYSRIIESAAEQAKQFAVPTLSAPVAFTQAITQHMTDTARIFFCDPLGTSFMQQITSAAHNPSSPIVLIAGPEGDLTMDEKKFLRETHIPFCSLTPTILRAFQAMILSAALFRCAQPTKS